MNPYLATYDYLKSIIENYLKIYWTVSNVNDSILLQSDLDSIGS